MAKVADDRTVSWDGIRWGVPLMSTFLSEKKLD
jgi:hypothetical protein